MGRHDGTGDKAGFRLECQKREVVGSRGVVASNSALASLAGVEVLARGGNAVDAAVATAFAQSVVEPSSTGIFGAGFTVYYQASSKQVYSIDHYAVSPKKASPSMFTTDDKAGPMETVGMANKVGYLSVGAPGNLKGWCDALERWGTMGLAEVTAPATRLAEEGYRVSPYFVSFIEREKMHLAKFGATASVFMSGGKPMEAGNVLKQTDFAKTLRTIAREGDGVLYGGRLGAEVAEDMTRNGGLVTLEDLASYQIRERKPVRGTYRGHEVVSMGPTSSGGVHIIQALNLLEGFDVKGMGYGSVEYFHLLLEALKVCWADRFAFLGDPEQVPVPVEGLTSRGYAEKRRGELDLERAKEYKAGDLATPESSNTTHLTVADREGNVVTMTHTLNDAFGSRVMVPGTGMLMNNCMALFDPHEGRPNSVGSGKRMVSSMSPSIIFKDGRPWFALGTPGGIRIFASVLQGIVNVIDHGMTLQEAVEAPRIWTQGGVVEVESGVAEEVREGLRRKGHRVSVVEKVAGGMNGVMFGDEGIMRGAACWRADGSPAGFSGGPARGTGGY